MADECAYRLMPYGKEKSTERASELKIRGNALYRQKKLEAAQKCYAEALFAAPWPEQPLKQIMDKLFTLHPQLEIVLMSPTPSATSTPQSLLGVCYGNLSAVFFEMQRYEDSLASLNEALTLSSSSSSCAKLYRRKVMCLSHLGRQAESREVLHNYTQLLAENDEQDEQRDSVAADIEVLQRKMKACQIECTTMENTEKEDTTSFNSCTSCSVCLHQSREKGRYLVTRKDVKFGEQLLCEKAYVAVLNAKKYLYTHCSYCLTRCATLKPCPFCPNAGYCSIVCLCEAWLRYHWLECRIAAMWKKVDFLWWIGLRMLLSAPHDEIRRILVDSLQTPIARCIERACTDPSYLPSYSAVLTLISHAGRYGEPHELTSAMSVSSNMVVDMGDAMVSYYGLEEHKKKALDSLKSLIFHHLLQLRCNSHTVSFLGTEEEEEGEREQERGEDCSKLQLVLEEKLGVAVYLTASFLNHACDPNTAFRFVNNWLVVAASTDVPSGAELTHTYGPQIGKHLKLDRQALLKKRFFFDCKCSVCYRPTKPVLLREYAWNGYLCPKCKGVLPCPAEGGVQSTCIECRQAVDMSSILKKEKKSDKLFSRGTANGKLSLAELQECEHIRSKVLHKFNKKLACTRDAIGQYHAINSNYSKAVHYCTQSCGAVQAIHGSESIELALELLKVAQMYLHGSCFKEAYSTASKILPTSELYLGPAHPHVVELKNIIAVTKYYM